MGSKQTCMILRYGCILFLILPGVITIINCGGGDIGDIPDFVHEDRLYTSVATGDLNNDGLSDIVAVFNGPGSYPQRSFISILLQDPNNPGSFQQSGQYAVGYWAWSIAIGDLNDDGYPDLVAANQLSDSISILFQNASSPGIFLSAVDFRTGRYPEQVAIGDMNGDGLNDIVAADDRTSIILQDAGAPGTFFLSTSLNLRSNSVAIGDLNADNFLDLATTRASTGAVAVSLQDPINPGQFLPAKYFATGNQPTFVAIGYIDDDLLHDLVVVNYGSPDGSIWASISILLQNNTLPGDFRLSGEYLTGQRTNMVVIEDLNADNLNDLVDVNDIHPGTTSVLFQNPNDPGKFLNPGYYSMFFQPLSLSVDDLNADSLPDIAVADDGILVLFQEPGRPGQFSAYVRVGG